MGSAMVFPSTSKAQTSLTAAFRGVADGRLEEEEESGGRMRTRTLMESPEAEDGLDEEDCIVNAVKRLPRPPRG